MITRGEIVHQYRPQPGERVKLDGAVRVNVIRGIPQTWAVSRPCSYPDANGSPYYCHRDGYTPYAHGGVVALTPAKPHLEMDPSDSRTWQRDYRFSSLEG